MVKLSDLKPGQGGVIEQVTDEEKVLKLLEMGCIPGEKVRVENVAPSGDPIAIHIAGYKLSLRKRDAEKILVRIQPTSAKAVVGQSSEFRNQNG